MKPTTINDMTVSQRYEIKRYYLNKGFRTGFDDAVKLYCDERDKREEQRLVLVRDFNDVVNKLIAENKRLRSALEKIKDNCQCETEDRDVCFYIATKALAIGEKVGE